MSVYLDVEVDVTLIEERLSIYRTRISDGVPEFLNKKGENHLIIPIGTAIIDEKNKWVTTNQIDSTTFFMPNQKLLWVHLQMLDLGGWLIALSLGLVPLFINEIVKIFIRARIKK